MDPSPRVVSAPFSLGAKGRIVVPVAVRRAAGVADDATVVAHAEGVGRIVIETTEAIRARVWDAAPDPVGLDTTGDVRALRSEDTDLADQTSTERSVAVAEDSDEVGAQLLRHLGL
jgi:bifunctional DNA-binding transcriptional regulator/antitoxin component of YhaV-PrlF toxin-antitoxin module